ncbi:hypothetical protein, partial [Burkholderia multivorans]|uniref:hypothetical protein n=1 Tax=Burkholderia multivorans TaxID=87883 RepID=UPI001C26AEC3
VRPEYERNSPRMSSNSYVNLKIATCLVRYADDRLIDQRFLSVPVEYRDGDVVDVREAMGIAEEYAKSIGCLIGGASPRSGYAPLFWAFDIVNELGRADKAGGVVMVDRLDGHVWTMAEYEEYMYDYNNVF